MADAVPHCKACRTVLDPAVTRGRKNGYDFLPCRACGTITVHPFPTLQQMMDYYQSYKGTATYTPKEEKKIRRTTRRIRRLLPRAKGRRFLDVGCNLGYAVKAAQNLGLEAFGIDVDADAVAASKKAYGDAYFAGISVQDYAAQGHKADIVHTSEVVEHVLEPDSFIAAIAQILDKDGILYLTCPDGGHWSLPRNFPDWRMAIPPDHVTYFSRRGMRILLEKHGFSIEKFFFTLKPGIRLIARKR